jgi:Domain of unknown function DUF11
LISASGGIFLLQACAQRPGASATVTIVVQPTAIGTITNSVAVASVEADDNPNNNSDSEDTTVNELLCNGLVPTIVRFTLQ